MEIQRTAAASTYVVFPMLSPSGQPQTGLTVVGGWLAWDDTTAPSATPGFRTLSGAVVEIGTSAVYKCALASTELPVASPFVMLRFSTAGIATQYLLVRTASLFANMQAVTDGAITSIGTGAITSAAFAAGAIDAAAIAANAIGASELAADGASEYADAFLGRNLHRGTSGGRTVGQALMALRNKVSIAAGTLTVTGEDDTTAEWTATVATQAVTAIVTSIDPA